MPNLYGVANAGIVFYPPAFLSISDTVITHDVFTVVYTSAPLTAPTPGVYYAVAWCTLQFTAGASAPSGLNLAISIGAGSTQNTASLGASFIAINTSYVAPMMTFTSPSETAWKAPGSTVSIQVNPGVQNITVRNLSSIVLALMRAPDQ